MKGNLEFIDVEQGSPEWHQYRSESLGSSEFKIAAGHGVTRQKLLVAKVIELATGQRDEGFCGGWMSRGHMVEQIAADWLSETLGIEFAEIGMVRNKLFPGGHDSSDRLVAGEFPPRWTEIKCPSPKIHREYLEKWRPVPGWCPTAYDGQLLTHRVILGTGGWFCSFHPDFEVQVVSVIPPPTAEDIARYRAVLDRWRKDYAELLPQAGRLAAERLAAKEIEAKKDAVLVEAAKRKLREVLKNGRW